MTNSFQTKEKRLRWMDLCCGCGIQGIFAYYISTYYRKLDEVVCVDINTRACHFVSANIALNGLGDDTDLVRPAIYAMQADVLQPFGPEYGSFDCILCNPPFVAVPKSLVSTLNSALYAIGGGRHGMNVLRGILNHVDHLLMNNSHSIILMVTELPNIEDSDYYVENLLAERLQGQMKIRIAFIKEDVEETAVYNEARSSENGITMNFNWAEDLHDSKVKNRALALVSILNDEDPCHAFRIHGMEKKMCYEDTDSHRDIIDEEDAFLTRAGVKFSRDRLLYDFNEHDETA